MISEPQRAAPTNALRVGQGLRRHEPTLVWLGLMLYLALVKVSVDTWLPGAFADPDQASLFLWPAIGVYTLVGLVGAWLSDHSGFPRPWTGWVISRRAALLPLVGGLALGAALQHFSKRLSAACEQRWYRNAVALRSIAQSLCALL